MICKLKTKHSKSPFRTDYCQAIVKTLPLEMPLSILEIGAGTGATTSYLLPELPPEPTMFSLTSVLLFSIRLNKNLVNIPIVFQKNNFTKGRHVGLPFVKLFF